MFSTIVSIIIIIYAAIHVASSPVPLFWHWNARHGKQKEAHLSTREKGTGDEAIVLPLIAGRVSVKVASANQICSDIITRKSDWVI